MKKIMVMGLMATALVACKEEDYSSAYLMQHPLFLMQEVNRCEAMAEKTPEQVGQCDKVMAAAVSVKAIVDDEQSDPERFGKRIMDTEAASVKTEADVREAALQLDALKAKQATAEAITAAQDKLNKAQRLHNDAQEEVKVLLAVAGLNSPE